MSTEAPSTRAIRNFKGNFRAAVRSILTAARWDDAAFERERKKLKTTARRQISFNLGAAMNQETLDSGKKVYDYFAARLTIRVTTGRLQGQAFPSDEACDLHEAFSAAVLDLFTEDSNPFDDTNLPYYAVKAIVPQGTRSDFDVIYLEDWTDLEFALEFGIHKESWPAVFRKAA